MCNFARRTCIDQCKQRCLSQISVVGSGEVHSDVQNHDVRDLDRESLLVDDGGGCGVNCVDDVQDETVLVQFWERKDQFSWCGESLSEAGPDMAVAQLRCTVETGSQSKVYSCAQFECTVWGRVKPNL